MFFFLPPASDRPPIRLIVVTLLTSLLSTLLLPPQSQAQAAPYCQQSQAAIDQKETLRRVAARGNKDAQKRYASLVKQHGDRLQKCRKQTQLQTQAIWLRLYPCDAKPGALESVLDQIVNRGYSQVNVEAFYNGRVLLPATDNPTAWASVLAGSKAEQADLLAEIIRKGRARGAPSRAHL